MVVSQHAPYAEEILTKISATFSSNPVSAVEVMFQNFIWMLKRYFARTVRESEKCYRTKVLDFSCSSNKKRVNISE